MSLSPEQVTANEKSAHNLALTKAGLTGVPQLEWSYDQRAAYDTALADIILAYPDRFLAQAVTTAHNVKQKDYTPLANDSFSFSDFGSDVASNANDLVGTPLVNLGKSVSNAFNILGTVGPYLAVAGAIFVGYMYFKGKGKLVSKGT